MKTNDISIAQKIVENWNHNATELYPKILQLLIDNE